ncbi:maltose operon protein [Vibrio zhanjiangensis]|uniref:Maltose operon protein n=1 Tax=Vibrio zhanjiangensis TaxID=1046128 RepID=A0ABQ6F026_9VIBR|nr:MalM family protein [Vibrio zhanjiangensis]GLT18296.1 maltose operon protein [Vibrio zhanjiangensis]
MYFRILVLGSCMALFGCQSSEVVEQKSSGNIQQATLLSELQSVQMSLPSAKSVNITPQSQALKYRDIDSPVALFELPANRGEFSIDITSEIGETAFVPSALIIDKNGRELERYGQDKFVYKPPRFGAGNRLSADVDFFPPRDSESVYLLVYTDKAELDKHTMVTHPARLYAEGRGNYLPEVKDIAIPNSAYGKISVSIDRVGFLKPLGTASSSSASSSQPLMAKSVEVVQPETQQYYHQAIAAAVAEDDLNKAIHLLEEAKALNVQGAQQVFVDAVKENKPAL